MSVPRSAIHFLILEAREADKTMLGSMTISHLAKLSLNPTCLSDGQQAEGIK